MKKIQHYKITYYDAILLSSSFNEKLSDLNNFVKHLCSKAKNVKNTFNILPVIVFEQKEKEKAHKLREKFKNGFKQIYPLILTNNISEGFSSCLNYGLANTYSKYVIRIDTDDLIIKDRIKNQLCEMEKYDLDFCSGYMSDQNNKIMKYPRNKLEIIKYIALGANPIAHPSICINKKNRILYSEELHKAEDFDLWIRLLLSTNFKFKCLKYPITKYNNSRSLQKDADNAKAQINIRLNYLRKIFLVAIALLIGIFPNLIRLVIGKNLLLKLRRKF